MKRLFLQGMKPLSHWQLRERNQRVDHEVTHFYINRLPSHVYIRDRSGLLTQIKPRPGLSAFEPDSFYICEHITCTPEIIQDYVQQSRNTTDKMRQYRHQAVLQNWTGEPPISARYSVEVVTPLKLSVLLENEGVIYLEDHDLLVMYGLSMREMERIRHPYTLAGYAKQSYKQISKNNPNLRRGDFTFNIRIVDNQDQFGSRWILIDEEPFCIVPCKDDEVTDGIYVTYSKNMLNGDGPQKLFIDRFDFEDSGNLPFYKLYESRQEALLARRSVHVDEANARIRELESKSAAAENSLRKAQQERENLEREAQLRREKHEQDMLKLRREHEKLQQEHKHYLERQVGETLATSRKNTTEIIKCVPAIISTIAVAVSLFSKKE